MWVPAVVAIAAWAWERYRRLDSEKLVAKRDSQIEAMSEEYGQDLEEQRALTVAEGDALYEDELERYKLGYDERSWWTDRHQAVVDAYRERALEAGVTAEELEALRLDAVRAFAEKRPRPE
ncbi:MAG: hypothetical protein ACRBN8_46875 [Nannocystales bacterium]